MGYRGHVLVTMLLFIVVGFFARVGSISWSIIGLGGLSMVLGGLFPDIDTASRGRRFFTLLLLAAVISCLSVGYYFTAALLFLVMMIALLARHRRMFHNIYFLAVLAVLFWWVSFLFFPRFWTGAAICMLFFVLGCWGHLIADFGLLRSLRNRF